MKLQFKNIQIVKENLKNLLVIFLDGNKIFDDPFYELNKQFTKEEWTKICDAYVIKAEYVPTFQCFRYELSTKEIEYENKEV